MLEQGIKIINLEFIRTPVLSQLSSVQFRPSTASFRGLPETSLDLTPSFKNSVYAKVEGLVSNVDYLENQRHNFVQKKYGRKTSTAHMFCSRDCNISLYTDFLHRWLLLKLKKE